MDLEINKVYQHKSGKLYTLIAISNLEATKDGWEQQAVYVDESNVVWTRPIEEFKKRVDLTKENIFAKIQFKSKPKVKDPEWIVKYPENGL